MVKQSWVVDWVSAVPVDYQKLNLTSIFPELNSMGPNTLSLFTIRVRQGSLYYVIAKRKKLGHGTIITSDDTGNLTSN